MTGPRFEIESHAVTATLYLHRPFESCDLRDVRIACALLPPEVRRLRIDAHSLEHADRKTRELLREIVSYWRTSRGGGLELCRTELCLGMAPTTIWPTVQACLVTVSEDAALQAVFL